jgi:hypothetical protein
MYKIAFHLARGANFQKWQIRDANNDAVYIDPAKHDLILKGCKLRNQKAASLKIFNGGDKARCSWIEFESYEVVEKWGYTSDVEVRFNPRVCPTWMIAGLPEQDNTTHDTIVSNGNKLYK